MLPEDVIKYHGLKAGATYVALAFKDNGIGFEQQYAEQIFIIFQRLNNQKAYGGTGIGLALCKKIVENHHGMIKVDSEPGIGTSFYIYLPVNQSVISGGESVVRSEQWSREQWCHQQGF